MSSFVGALQVGLELGADAILVKPKRQIGDFVAQVTIKEEHHDSLQITEQPVEQGANITDHAFKRPNELVIEAGWSNTPSSNAVGSSSSLLGSLAGAVTGTIGGVVDLATQAGSAFNGLNGTIGQLSDVVTQPLATASKYVQGAITPVTDGVISAVQGVIPEGVTGFISNVPGGVVNAISSSPLGALAGDVAGGIGGAVSSALGDFSDFGGSLGGVSSSVSGSNVGQVKDIYAKFLALQATALPFDVFTGKRFYQDMLIQDLYTVTDKETENSLRLRIHLKQIIIVSSATTMSVTSDQSAQSSPEDTAPSADNGDAQLNDATNYDEAAGDESIAADPPVEGP